MRFSFIKLERNLRKAESGALYTRIFFLLLVVVAVVVLVAVCLLLDLLHSSWPMQSSKSLRWKVQQGHSSVISMQYSVVN